MESLLEVHKELLISTLHARCVWVSALKTELAIVVYLMAFFHNLYHTASNERVVSE
jgi:hypothetical protein